MSLYRNKGQHKSLDSECKTFLMTGYRKILDSLIYNDIFNSVDDNMSDSNIGARKAQNIRNHLFIVYAIRNCSQKKTKGNYNPDFWPRESFR